MSDPGPMIPLFDLRLEDEDLEAVARVLRSGTLTLGPATESFEAAFAAHLGVKHTVAVSSCTAALHLAYAAAGVGPGDEVIVTAFTFAATATAVLYCGATPVFADIVGPEDPSIDPEHVAALITPRTKAVGVVHFGGYPAPIAALRALCDEHGLALIEDAAHAPSAARDGRKLGTWGLAGCFSFFSNKVLSGGEGGLLATDDDAVAAHARALRSDAVAAGARPAPPNAASAQPLALDYRLDEARCALIESRLGRLEADIAQRRDRTLRYRRLLAGQPGVTVPYADADVADSSCYVMPLMLEDPARQGPVRLALREKHAVQTSLLYPAVHEFTAYRERFPGIDLPRTERAARSEVTVPLFPHMTDEQQDRVVAALAEEL